MEDVGKIKDKIKKLLALSKSPNANEAASALEMAQNLLRDYNLAMDDINIHEIGEDRVRSFTGEKPPKYIAHLVNDIAEAFGCDVAYCFRQWDRKSHFTYVGVEHRVEMAVFITEVLFRKIKRARMDYLKSLTRVKDRARRTKRADDFCLGWVHTVCKKLHAFVITPSEKGAIERYVEKLGWSNTLQTINRGAIDGRAHDFGKGLNAGKGIELQHGVSGQTGPGPALIEA